jgi:S-adenosylmethionine decarboxylase
MYSPTAVCGRLSGSPSRLPSRFFRGLFMNRCFCTTLFFFVVLVSLSPLYGEAVAHEFRGHHLIVSYKGCNTMALSDIGKLKEVFEDAVKASGATVLSSAAHVFAPDGLTMVILLSESHASIHTYPEYNACFIDLFTCGEKCDPTQFELILACYLRPQEVNRSLMLRN